MAEPLRILVLIGTRPEAIKLAPVVHELTRHAPAISAIVCAAGQHREILGPTLAAVGLHPVHNLEVMETDQSLADLTSRLFDRVDRVIADHSPDWMLVQGDTTTAMVGAMAAFYRRVRVAHVEAGLRTGDLGQPFPEELNRRICDLCADLCFAPTARAREHLLREGIPANRIHVTGNTIVDAVLEMAARPYDEQRGPLADVPRAKRWMLVTTHRRENFGAPLEHIYAGVRRLAEAFADSLHVIVPVHPNPNVGAVVTQALDLPNCSVLPPLDYPDLVHVLRRSALVLTDSGGLQEEAPVLGVPVLVLREKTERPEGIDAGVARLVGTDPDRIVAAATAILEGERGPASPAHPYGDGQAAKRIVAILRDAVSSI